MDNKIFSDIIKRLNKIKQIEHLTDKEIQLLSVPRKVSYAKLKINNKILPAWRIVFNNTLGPGKGGIRFHPNVSEDEVKSLAFWMMIKNSLAELPYGGAKGGVRFDPTKVSPKMLETVSRKFVDAFYKVLGQDKDIPAPDVYTNSQVMAWMLDEYEKKIGRHEPGMITGKPLNMQGCSLRADATARGGFIIIQQLVKKFLTKKTKPIFAVQGFGNAGANVAQILNKAGFKIVAVSDSKEGIYDKKGLKIDKLREIKKQTGRVSSGFGGKKITNQELLELPVDVLVLAALENQITNKNADQIKAKYIVELANGPITYMADKKLHSRGIWVIPDILANSGGVIVSYFEWAQNRTGNILDKRYLKKFLEQKMIKSWNKVIRKYKEYNDRIDLRTSAYIIAINKILSVERSRGNL